MIIRSYDVRSYDNACLEPFNSVQGMNSNTEVDDRGIGHSDIPINDEDEH